MRKFSSVLVLLALLVFAIVPTFAQDATIAEIVVASAESDDAEFTTLLAAVGLADPAVLEALADPDGDWTVFAPTDAAFAELAEALGEEAFTAVLEDTDALTSILLFHVLDGSVYSEDVVALLEATDNAFAVPSMNGQFIDIYADDMGIYIDGAELNLELIDIEASNGVIHVINSVILPESRTIAEIVVESAEADEAEFTTLLGAVGLADPAVLEALMDAEAELTVFAPTDAAFAALAEALGDDAFAAVLDDAETLTNILLYHVIDGVVFSTDAAAALEENMGSFEAEMLNGAMALVEVTDEGNISIAGATIIVTNIDAANGVIHVIDAVMVPPSE